MNENRKMGRPYIYDPNKPRRQRGIQLSDELWEALNTEAGVGKVALYLEQHLREIPAIKARLNKQ